MTATEPCRFRDGPRDSAAPCVTAAVVARLPAGVALCARENGGKGIARPGRRIPPGLAMALSSSECVARWVGDEVGDTALSMVVGLLA